MIRQKLTTGVFLAGALLAGCGESAPTPEKIRALLPPAIDGAVADVRTTPIEGLYEATVAGQIIYVHPKTNLFVVGNLVTREGKSLTGEARQRIEAQAATSGKLLVDAALAKAVTVGKGKHKIIEITDPDCPFCRKLHGYLADKDVTRSVFLTALPMHPGAAAKNAYILAATPAEQATRLHEVFAGAFDKKAAPAGNKGLAAEHKALAEKVALGGTPILWIDGQFVHGFDKKKLDELLAP